MSDVTLTLGRGIRRIDPVVLAGLAGFAALALLDRQQAGASLVFVLEALAGIAPFLLVSIGVAAYAKASGADALIARAFAGSPAMMVVGAALVGALSPFCSCGVIPVIAALLSMGVPLAPVMAFWLASPLMDPSMFFLTTGALGLEFALFKTFAAVSVGLIGGFGTLALVRAGGFTDPLREGIGNGGCGAATVRSRRDVVWKFWPEPERRRRFATNATDNLLFLGKWLAVAFFLESLMLAWLPAETVAAWVGGGGGLTVVGARLVGVPAYLNGYAALPLVAALLAQGMAPGAGMAFLLAGGVSSIPAAIAVWALARPPVFAAYLGFAFIGAFGLGSLYGLVA